MVDGNRLAGDHVVGEGVGVALRRGWRERETRVGHAERGPQALAQCCAQRLAGHRLDDEAEHVGGEAVLPLRAGLEQQRRLGQRIEEQRLRQGDGGDHRRARRELVSRRRAALAIGHAGGVTQEILDGRLALERQRLGVVGGERPRDAQRLQLGEEFGGRVGQQHAAFLDQLHDHHGNHRLGHRSDREHRIGGERRLGLRITLADGIEVHGAELENGLLSIDLARPQPQRLVRKIEIGGG
mgnify:CR=1 FL=1